jgi:MFS family permease
MITTYRRVLGLPGALVFSLSGLLARLPISMVSLGIVLLVSTRTGSYTRAGAVSASFLIANAVLAVFQARLIDRMGQSRVLPFSIGVFATGLVLMMTVVERGVPAPWPYVFAAVSGAAMPQIGSCVRARWSALVPDRALLQTAFAFEAVVDETVFVVGPTLVTLLATTVHPLAGLSAAVVAGVSGTAVLVSQRRTEPVPGGPVRHATSPMPWRVLAPLTVSAFTMGVLFGGAEVATVAFCDEAGHKALSGVLLATWSLGSLLSGAAMGAMSLSASNATRYRWGLLCLGLLLVPLPFVTGFPMLLGRRGRGPARGGRGVRHDTAHLARGSRPGRGGPPIAQRIVLVSATPVPPTTTRSVTGRRGRRSSGRDHGGMSATAEAASPA